MLDGLADEVVEPLSHFRMWTKANHAPLSKLSLCDRGRPNHNPLGRAILGNLGLESRDCMIILDIQLVARRE